MQAPQVLPSLLFLCLLAFSSPANAQSQDTLTRRTSIRTETSTKTFQSEQITAYVNGHQTKIEVLGLFKPAEIEMRSDRSAEQKSDYMMMHILVKDKDHPVLTYFAQKAKLQYKGKLYEHNVIPDINAAKVSRVQYHSFKGTDYEGQLENYLEVVLYGEEHVPHETTVFRTEPGEITYYDVDGKILTQAELPVLHKGTFTKQILYGREAVERYGDAKFKDGIVIIRTKK